MQSDDAGTAADAATDADEPAPPVPSKDAGPDAEMIDSPRDRCLEGSCGEAVLPRQPEYEFLAEAEDGWLRLVQADWQLAPKSEGYRCVRKTITEDVYITAFRPVNPPGTHHTTLHIESGGTDGVSVCGVSAGGSRRLQGSGVGTEPTSLPSGVAMKLSAGEQVLMNLHLFNFSDQPLSGTSGTWIKRLPKADVTQEAEVVLAGPLGLTIPPGTVTQTGSCTLRSAVTLFSLTPHMHQLGRHMKVTAHSSLAGERVLHDQAFDFTHQLLYPVEQVPLAAGDRVSIECTYQNETTRMVGWGDSTLDEMCFVGLGLYPAFGAGGFPCSN
jgi:hypothetical protein